MIHETAYPISGQELETAIASISDTPDFQKTPQFNSEKLDTNGWVFNLSKYGNTWRNNSGITTRDVFNWEYQRKLQEAMASQENDTKDRSQQRVTFDFPTTDKPQTCQDSITMIQPTYPLHSTPKNQQHLYSSKLAHDPSRSYSNPIVITPHTGASKERGQTTPKELVLNVSPINLDQRRMPLTVKQTSADPYILSATCQKDGRFNQSNRSASYHLLGKHNSDSFSDIITLSSSSSSDSSRKDQKTMSPYPTSGYGYISNISVDAQNHSTDSGKQQQCPVTLQQSPLQPKVRKNMTPCYTSKLNSRQVTQSYSTHIWSMNSAPKQYKPSSIQRRNSYGDKITSVRYAPYHVRKPIVAPAIKQQEIARNVLLPARQPQVHHPSLPMRPRDVISVAPTLRQQRQQRPHDDSGVRCIVTDKRPTKLSLSQSVNNSMNSNLIFHGGKEKSVNNSKYFTMLSSADDVSSACNESSVSVVSSSVANSLTASDISNAAGSDRDVSDVRQECVSDKEESLVSLFNSVQGQISSAFKVVNCMP